MSEVGRAGGAGAEKLGYLGLGMMGFPMTRRLINAGYDVTVWNRSPGKAKALIEAGARLAPQPRDVAATADIIFMCLTDAAAVDEVVFGPGGLATVTGRGKLVVDFSSIHPDAARSIAARLKTANGIGWIDAPVSGGTKGAEEGTLAVMAGGNAADIEKVRPYILAMARRLTHMGPPGAGQTTKLCNQVVVGCAMGVGVGSVMRVQADRLAAHLASSPRPTFACSVIGAAFSVSSDRLVSISIWSSTAASAPTRSIS